MRLHSISLFLIFILSASILNAQDLAFYMEQAKLNSPLIQDHKNQSEAAQLEAERLKAFYTKAQISVTGSYLFAPIINRDNGKSSVDLNPSGTQENYSGYDLAASNGGVYQGLLNINQPLFNGVRYEAAAELNTIGVKVNENTIALTEHELEKVITDQYILCLQDFKQSDYLSTLCLIINNQKDIVFKLVESGIAKQSDLSLLFIEEKTQQTALSLIKSTYTKDLMDLRVLCGISDTSYQVLSDIDLQLSEEVVESQFTEKFRLDSLALVANQNIFELKYKPVVGAFANTGLNAVYAPTIPNRFGFSAGVNFTMNLTDGNQRKISQQRTAILMRSTRLYKTFFDNQNKVRKGRILTELRSINEQITFTESQAKEYFKLLDSYKQELSLGQISVMNYISSLKNMASAQSAYVQLLTKKELLINLYNYWNW